MSKSRFADWDISVKCPSEAIAAKVAKCFQLYVCCSPGEVNVDGSTVNVSCFETFENQEFSELTAEYPGTFVVAKYITDIGDLGVVYSKDGRHYEEAAIISYPGFDEARMLPSTVGNTRWCQFM